MRALLVTLAAVAVPLAAPAQAADPVPGAVYAGASNQAKNPVRVAVAGSGTSIGKFVFAWRALRCRSERNRAEGKTTVRSIPVADGRFRARGTRRKALRATRTFSGGTEITRYRVTGAFASGERARGTLRVTVTVVNRAGITIDTCRMSKAARWRATRLGVTVPE